jgi:hypothetical protein
VKAAVALAAALLAACAGPAAVKPPSASAADAVRRRAAASESAPPAVAAATGTNEAAPARNEAQSRSGKVLGTDADGCTWIAGEATVSVGEQDTRHQARAAAIEQARAAAVQDFLGVDVRSRLLDFQQEGLRRDAHLTESILQTTRNGRVLKEQILSEGYRDAPDCPGCRYAVALKDCVVPRLAESDKNFRVELGLSRTRFVAGDAALISVTATRDCTVYLYDVYDLGATAKTSLVVPNAALASKTLRAGESWTYPDDDAHKAGIKDLEAELPDPADDVSAETIRVVASKAPLPPSVYDPTIGGWFGVMQRLNREKVEWTDDAEAFTVYRK